jgi:hypothetical protein
MDAWASIREPTRSWLRGCAGVLWMRRRRPRERRCYRRRVVVASSQEGRRGSPRLGLAFVAALALAGCKDKELQQQQIAENAKKITADSTSDATAPLVDEGYRFRIEWPGEGWKLLGPDEAKRIAPDAVAGAVKLPSAFMVVIVERAPSTEIDALVDLVLSNDVIVDRVVESKETVQFAGRDARRVTWTGRVEGVQFRWIDTLFLHEGHGYQVLGWGPADTFDAQDIAPAWLGFSILPGEVVGPTVVAESDRTGPGWRQVGGVFESAVSGLRVQPPSGWRVVTGSALELMNAEAEVGMEGPGVGAFMVLLPERIGKTTDAGFRKTMVEQLQRKLGAPTGEWTTTLAGKSTVFSAFQQPPIELVLGTFVAGEVGVQVLAWYSMDSRDVAREALPSALAGISTIDAKARVALRTELEGEPDSQSGMGVNESLRRGTFRDFAAKVVWKKPPGLWRLSSGDKSGTPVVESLELENLDSGIAGHIVIEHRPGVDANEWHDERVARHGGKKSPRRTVELANAQAQVTNVEVTNGALDVEIAVGTVVHGEYAIELLLFAHAERMKGAAEEVRAVFGGLELADDLPKTSVEGGRYVDQRLGFAVVPPSDVRVIDETPKDKAGLGSFLLWKDGQRELRLLAMNWGGNATDSRFVTQLIEQGAREEMTKRLGAATSKQTTLAGITAEHTSWSSMLERADLVVASHDDSAFVFISVNHSESELGEVLKSFELLD